MVFLEGINCYTTYHTPLKNKKIPRVCYHATRDCHVRYRVHDLPRGASNPVLKQDSVFVLKEKNAVHTKSTGPSSFAL